IAFHLHVLRKIRIEQLIDIACAIISSLDESIYVSGQIQATLEVVRGCSLSIHRIGICESIGRPKRKLRFDSVTQGRDGIHLGPIGIRYVPRLHVSHIQQGKLVLFLDVFPPLITGREMKGIEIVGGAPIQKFITGPDKGTRYKIPRWFPVERRDQSRERQRCFRTVSAKTRVEIHTPTGLCLEAAINGYGQQLSASEGV